MPLRQPGHLARSLKTGQTTIYHIADDGSFQKGIAKRYTVLATGAYAGTVLEPMWSVDGGTIQLSERGGQHL